MTDFVFRAATLQLVDLLFGQALQLFDVFFVRFVRRVELPFDFVRSFLFVVELLFQRLELLVVPQRFQLNAKLFDDRVIFLFFEFFQFEFLLGRFESKFEFALELLLLFQLVLDSLQIESLLGQFHLGAFLRVLRLVNTPKQKFRFASIFRVQLVDRTFQLVEFSQMFVQIDSTIVFDRRSIDLPTQIFVFHPKILDRSLLIALLSFDDHQPSRQIQN